MGSSVQYAELKLSKLASNSQDKGKQKLNNLIHQLVSHLCC